MFHDEEIDGAFMAGWVDDRVYLYSGKRTDPNANNSFEYGDKIPYQNVAYFTGIRYN